MYNSTYAIIILFIIYASRVLIIDKMSYTIVIILCRWV